MYVHTIRCPYCDVLYKMTDRYKKGRYTLLCEKSCQKVSVVFVPLNAIARKIEGEETR